jgi:hypothetical protein
MASDCASQLGHHLQRTLLNGAVLVDADVDRRDGLVFHVGLHAQPRYGDLGIKAIACERICLARSMPQIDSDGSFRAWS